MLISKVNFISASATLLYTVYIPVGFLIFTTAKIADYLPTTQ
jgi:hypothetical protein